jgi:hypothetical protein
MAGTAHHSSGRCGGNAGAPPAACARARPPPPRAAGGRAPAAPGRPALPRPPGVRVGERSPQVERVSTRVRVRVRGCARAPIKIDYRGQPAPRGRTDTACWHGRRPSIARPPPPPRADGAAPAPRIRSDQKRSGISVTDPVLIMIFSRAGRAGWLALAHLAGVDEQQRHLAGARAVRHRVERRDLAERVAVQQRVRELLPPTSTPRNLARGAPTKAVTENPLENVSIH